MAIGDWQDRVNQQIVEFGLRVNSDSIYDLGVQRQAARHLSTADGLRQQTAMQFREDVKAKFAELGFSAPVYEVKEIEDEKRDAWRLKVEDKVGNRSYELELMADRLDGQQLNVEAVAYSSLREQTKANLMDEWKGSFKTNGESRIYLEAINAVAMVLSWLDPLAAPEVSVN